MKAPYPESNESIHIHKYDKVTVTEKWSSKMKGQI